MAFALNNPTGKIQAWTAGIMTVGLAATVGTALGFEHLAGFMPCKLCLEQRTPIISASRCWQPHGFPMG